MKLRNKLIFYFVAMVVITLITFGLSAYQVAGDNAIKRDKDLLESLVFIESKHILEEFNRGQSIDTLVRSFTDQRSDSHLWLLINKNYQSISIEQSDAVSLNGVTGIPLKEIVEAKENSGRYEFNNQLIIWAKSRIGETEYTLAHVYAPAYNANEYSNKLATRLIVVAVIIFWMSVWAALIISTVITRKIKEQQARIEYQANHDILTGLQNRYYLVNKIDATITSKTTPSFAVIIIGIDRFREINDTLGHDFGDLLLKEFGNRLQAEFWSNDTIARFGSDQFSLLLPLSDLSHLKIVMGKIEKILGIPFLIQDIHIATDVGIGISLFPEHGNTAAQLLRCAEVAMYMAKKSGSLFESYDPKNDPNSLDRLQLVSELNYAIEKGELELHFQPKIDIRRHKLISCEALLRWNNGARGRIPPDIFIPLAEQGSIIKDLTEWVLEQSVMNCVNWQKSGMDISISVNLSARLLIEDETLTMVTRVLEKYELNPKYLILEITESAIMMDPIRAKKMMEQINNIGASLSIDDFGTGYTSISQIKNLPVSEIKIDKSFVLNMLKDKGDAMLVKLIIDMAHGMGHIVVAEGIENQEVFDQLRALGCDIAQGYYLGRPMPASQFTAYKLT